VHGFVAASGVPHPFGHAACALRAAWAARYAVHCGVAARPVDAPW
jgi:hypothetical protein